MCSAATTVRCSAIAVGGVVATVSHFILGIHHLQVGRLVPTVKRTPDCHFYRGQTTPADHGNPKIIEPPRTHRVFHPLFSSVRLGLFVCSRLIAIPLSSTMGLLVSLLGVFIVAHNQPRAFFDLNLFTRHFPNAVVRRSPCTSLVGGR